MIQYRVVSKREIKEYAIKDDKNKKADFLRKKIFGECPHAGKISTPYSLCEEIVNRLPNLNGKLILVLFTPEFYFAIRNKYPTARIIMATGCDIYKKFKCIEKFIKINPHNVSDLRRINMKFDVVIGNPPYQDKDRPRSPLWEKFVEKSFELCKEKGIISLIHPSAWRKPIHKLFPFFQRYNLKYLEIHDQKDGMKVFSAGTRYDWYVLEKIRNMGKTKIIEENGKIIECDISKMECIPNRDIEFFRSLLANKNEERCKVMYSRSAYATDKSWVNKIKKDNFIYPVVYTTRKNGPTFWYSCENNYGHFGVKKIIMGITSPENGFYDHGGEYGVSQFAMFIPVSNDRDAENILKCIKTEKFKDMTRILKWAGPYTDYRALAMLKNKFWENFI